MAERIDRPKRLEARSPGVVGEGVEGVGASTRYLAETPSCTDLAINRMRRPSELPDDYVQLLTRAGSPSTDVRWSIADGDSPQGAAINVRELAYIEAKTSIAAKNSAVELRESCSYPAVGVLRSEFATELHERLGSASGALKDATIGVDWGLSKDGDVRMSRLWWETGEGQRIELARDEAMWEARVRDRLDERYADLPVRSLQPGKKGDWTKELHKPSADTIYDVGGTTYVTDSRGRVEHIEARLTYVEPAEADLYRNTYQQGIAGKGAGRLSIDQGGHIIAVSLGGAGEGVNLVAMSKDLNGPGRSSWYSMEESWREKLKQEAGTDIRVKIEVEYADDAGKRPKAFRVTWSINGEDPTERVFFQ